jgi:hypothetical protein
VSIEWSIVQRRTLFSCNLRKKYIDAAKSPFSEEVKSNGSLTYVLSMFLSNMKKEHWLSNGEMEEDYKWKLPAIACNLTNKNFQIKARVDLRPAGSARCTCS